VGLGSLDAAASTPNRGARSRGNIEAFRRTYHDSRGRTLTVTWAGDTLRAALTGYRSAELIPRAAGDFVWFDPENNQDTRVTFGRDAAATVVIVRDRTEMFRSSVP